MIGRKSMLNGGDARVPIEERSTKAVYMFPDL
jgi:hypothetical protein